MSNTSTELIPTATRKRLPRRRRDFQGLTDEAVRAVVRRAAGPSAEVTGLQRPAQGLNNQTYLVNLADGPGLVIKMRPRRSDPPTRVRNSPQWPRYTQALLGPYPNGDIQTLPGVSALLEAHGAIPVPRVFLADESCELAPASFIVSERLHGASFDWQTFGPGAARQLGEHLARVHEATSGETFGIFARRDDFRASEWWPRFARAYRILLQELARGSERIAGIAGHLEAALACAVGTGTPASFPLICLDQFPTHYLRADDDRISGLIDVEGHLWAPREYELAMVELWVGEEDDFRGAYAARLLYPAAMDRLRPAYWFMTWMEWIYASYTLLHDEQAAVEMEKFTVLQAGRIVLP